MSKAGAGATILAMAGVGWLSTVLAEFLLAVTVGAVLMGVVALIMVVMGIIAYASAASDAIARERYGWLFNLVGAPCLAALSVFAIHPVYTKFWTTLIHFGEKINKPNPPFSLIIVVGIMGLAMFASIIAAPVFAVILICIDEVAAQVAGYICFFYTAGYWGIAIAKWTHYANWYPS